MYLEAITLKNIRSIAHLEWRPDSHKGAGWHVILGENGSGKTTFLRAVALALIGHENVEALRQDWTSWLRRGTKSAEIIARLRFDSRFDIYYEDTSVTDLVSFSSRLTIKDYGKEGLYLSGNELWLPKMIAQPPKMGWFSASYGPFRRFTGGDTEYEEIGRRYPILAPHLSIFRESMALTESLRWLQDLKFKVLEGDPEGALLAKVTDFINQEGFLPHQARLTEVTSRGVTFVDGNQSPVSLEDLSDGYRSILSLTFDILRHASRAYGPERLFNEAHTQVIVPGVILIDEVDAHLHPTWQRKIGFWFREHFPQIQFLIATHSPLVCQAAVEGTIFRLPRPGTEEKGEMLQGEELQRLLYGSVLDAYGTPTFGMISRSREGQEKLKRLATLNLKELREPLTTFEQQELQQLRDALPTDTYSLES